MMNKVTKYVAIHDGEIVQEFKTITAAAIYVAKIHRAGLGVDIKPVVHGTIIDKPVTIPEI